MKINLEYNEVIFDKILKRIIQKQDGQFYHTAEPAYNRLQGNKDVCLLEEKSITRGIE